MDAASRSIRSGDSDRGWPRLHPRDRRRRHRATRGGPAAHPRWAKPQKPGSSVPRPGPPVCARVLGLCSLSRWPGETGPARIFCSRECSGRPAGPAARTRASGPARMGTPPALPVPGNCPHPTDARAELRPGFSSKPAAARWRPTRFSTGNPRDPPAFCPTRPAESERG